MSKYKHIKDEWVREALDEYKDKIDENKFLGFPIMRKIGGWNMDDALDLKDPERTTCRISQEDTHPNGKGHGAYHNSKPHTPVNKFQMSIKDIANSMDCGTVSIIIQVFHKFGFS